MNGNLILDGQNDPNALFIFQIGAAFSTNAASNIIMINSASLCNVYWQVDGAVTLGDNSIFRGSLVTNGAISLSLNASLIGRGLTRAGAINLNTNNTTIGIPPTPSTISSNGPTSFCAGNNVILSGNVGGIWSNGATTASITVSTSGDYFVTNTNSCSINSNHIIVTVNELPIATTGSDVAICNGTNVSLGILPISGHTYLWSPTTGLSSAIIANPIANPSATTTYTLTETITATGCQKSNALTVTVNPLPTASIIAANGAINFCSGAGNSVTLSGNIGGIWSTGATTASIIVTTSGDYFVTNTNSCGSALSNHILITVNPPPLASIISASGPTTFCTGSSVDLTGNNGATWSTGSTNASITVTTSGDYFVTNTNGCGSVASNHISVTVNPLPSATTGGNASICGGISVIIGSAPILGHTYLWTPATGLSSATIANPLSNPSVLTTYILTETITATGCENSNSVIVNPQPSCSCACK